MPTEHFHQPLVIDVIKETFDIDIYHASMFHAIILALLQNMMRALSRTIAKRAVRKDLFQGWFQIVFYYSLCNPVRHRGNSQRPDPTLLLRNKHSAYRRRIITT